jgi:phosphoribosyl 1,2-cyclic phosphodiesterase
MVSYYEKRLMIDCGEDWNGKIGSLRPHALLLTHAHPDHAGGLYKKVPCPVFGTKETKDRLPFDNIDDYHIVDDETPVSLMGFTVTPFAVAHSIRAPAVGYRVTAGRVSIFYVPDVVYIYNRSAALSGIRVYIGDGATIRRSMVRKQEDALIGHTPIQTQLTWCRKENVPRAIFTHLGREIVADTSGEAAAEIRQMAGEREIDVRIACDDMEMVLR